LKGIQTPNSPGFQVLDISPDNIERPTNPKAFATSIYSLAGSGNIIPKNFAFEIAPYWYTKPTNATVYKYLNIKTDSIHSNIFTGIYNKMSLSIASTYSDSNNAALLKNTNYLSAGLRTNLLTIRTLKQSNNLADALNALSEILKGIETNSNKKKKQLKKEFVMLSTSISDLENLANSETISSKKDSLSHLIGLYIKEKQNIEHKIRDLINSDANEVEAASDNDKEFQEKLKELEVLPVFQLDAACAYSIALPDNSFSNKRFNRTAFWASATLNGQFNKDDLQKGNFYGMLYFRYMRDNVMIDTLKNRFELNSSNDIGIKVGIQTHGLTISYEFISRTYPGISVLNSNRSVGSLQYKVSEGLSIYGSFGENFSIKRSYFSSFGLNLGFGKTNIPVSAKSGN
jgi:hypothetical protein